MSTFVGGKLKLKGGVDVSKLKGGGVKKRKKKAAADAQALVPVDGDEQQGTDGAAAGGEGDKQAAQQSSRDGVVLDPAAVTDRRTEAEKKADAHYLKYEEQRSKKAAALSHRDRIKELNDKLATLTEHHDLFRISYT
ncbi:hypothetical protein D9Q98_006219 [Chlorella vulgaris]|uniref:DUF1754-domain-containing protein n=1 Tax=Chlorella vulgaris TaxID=3077 RepID=A0A9D4TX49_CHLVU|nr:hypothetical protein D9Q98_006219 [Chlorella vulgaris]